MDTDEVEGVAGNNRARLVRERATESRLAVVLELGRTPEVVHVTDVVDLAYVSDSAVKVAVEARILGGVEPCGRGQPVEVVDHQNLDPVSLAASHAHGLRRDKALL